jgi:hypothetical protein
VVTLEVKVVVGFFEEERHQPGYDKSRNIEDG